MNYKQYAIGIEQIKKIRDQYWGKSYLQKCDNLDELKHYRFNIYLSGENDTYGFDVHMILNHEQACKIESDINIYSCPENYKWKRYLEKFLNEVANACEKDVELRTWVYHNIRICFDNPVWILNLKEMVMDAFNILTQHGYKDDHVLSQKLLIKMIENSNLITMDATLEEIDEPTKENDFVLVY